MRYATVTFPCVSAICAGCDRVRTAVASRQLFDRDCDFAAAPDVFPPDMFNAGVLVLRPDAHVFEDMVAKASVLPSHDGGDTGAATSAVAGGRLECGHASHCWCRTQVS